MKFAAYNHHRSSLCRCLLLLILLSGDSLAGDVGSALYIAPDGHLGVGTEQPIAPLDIQQEVRTGKHPDQIDGLYVTGPFDEAHGVEFRRSNGSQGTGMCLGNKGSCGNDTSEAIAWDSYCRVYGVAIPRGNRSVLPHYCYLYHCYSK